MKLIDLIIIKAILEGQDGIRVQKWVSAESGHYKKVSSPAGFILIF
jgi:hypothetical protein